MRAARGAALILTLALASACGPHAAIPLRPSTVPDQLPRQAPDARLAAALAPVLYLQRDETFPLSRAVAVVHPDSQIIAYHLLWRDDAYGAWIPFTKPTDEEELWVAYDSTGAPTRLYTYWHGTILTMPWVGRQVAIDVQWGKHGSLPHLVDPSSLPPLQSLGVFYWLTWALPDFWLGRLTRAGPLCFCHGWTRYRDFATAVPLAFHLDAIVETADPRAALHAVFGRVYSEKPAWPWGAAEPSG